VTFPKRPGVRVQTDGGSAATLSPAERRAIDEDPVVIANRQRLARLHELRSKTPVDVQDALHGASWMLFVFVAIGAVCQVATDLKIAWVAGIAVVGSFALLAVCGSLLERTERRMWAASGHRIPDPPAGPTFHWRLITPASVVRRARAQIGNELAAVNVDDSELEDALDLLYRHGADNYDFRPTPPVRRREP
jgi:hypothetical protein